MQIRATNHAIAPSTTTTDLDVTPPVDTPTTTAPIAGASSSWQGFGAESMNALELSGTVIGDGARFAGVTPNGISAPTVGLIAADAGVAAIMGGVKARSIGNLGVGSVASNAFDQWALNKQRITPTLVSAVAGPAVADGVSMIAPNILPKYKKEMTESEKKRVQFTRLAIGGAAVGLLAAGVFLFKPDLFKRVGFFSEEALHGMQPMLNANGTKIGSSFTNQVLLGTAGGVAGLIGANKLMEGHEDASVLTKLGVAGGMVAAGALGGGLLGKVLTRGTESSLGVAFLPQSGLLAKPNKQWFIDYAKKIAPLTAVPAGTAASQYFNIVSDFEKITNPRSPFAQG